ncbi:MAG: Na+/H+ antiporter [Alphaproteobacteria bacterium]|nr:Na+/H+ antiporter [Alphaproteobacteria bacterium]
MLMPELPIAFGLVAITAASALAARRLQIAFSIMLVLVGLALGFMPFMPQVALRPDLVLSLLLPPLLYSSGVGMSWRGFKADLRAILQLAVGCVVFTAAVVAGVMHWLLGLPLAVGFVLGAVVSPPDAVAPMAIARRHAVPGRILTILEGEGLVNDATALILFSFAIAAVMGGAAFSLPKAVGEFLIIVTGEIAWGLGVGWASLALRRWASETRVEMVISLLTPFAAFWVPEALGGSGVLATVTCGLFVSWNGPRFISPATRLQGFFVWDLVVYLIEGVVFLLTGLQARIVVERLHPGDWSRVLIASAATCAAIVLVRFFWVFTVTYLPGKLWPAYRARHPGPPWRQVFVVAFTGIRGVVSLAAALSIPFMAGGTDFPDRDLLLLVTFVVILVTLVGQGLSFAWVIKVLGLAQDGEREAQQAKLKEVAARVKSIDAALARLDQLEGAASAPETVAALRRRHEDRRAYFVAACQDISEGLTALSSSALQLRFLEAERKSIADLYTRGEIGDEARRRIEREMDLEDSRLRHAAESGAARLI